MREGRIGTIPVVKAMLTLIDEERKDEKMLKKIVDSNSE